MTKKQQDELAVQVGRLATIFQNYSRLRRRFLSGMIFGFGSAVGASIVAGIVIYVATAILDATGIIELLQSITQIEIPAGTILESSQQ